MGCAALAITPIIQIINAPPPWFPSLATYTHQYKWMYFLWQLRARRALTLLNDVPLRTKRVLLLYKVYGKSTLLVLNGTSLNNINAILVLGRRYPIGLNYGGVLAVHELSRKKKRNLRNAKRQICLFYNRIHLISFIGDVQSRQSYWQLGLSCPTYSIFFF